MRLTIAAALAACCNAQRLLLTPGAPDDNAPAVFSGDGTDASYSPAAISNGKGDIDTSGEVDAPGVADVSGKADPADSSFERANVAEPSTLVLVGGVEDRLVKGGAESESVGGSGGEHQQPGVTSAPHAKPPVGSALLARRVHVEAASSEVMVVNCACGSVKRVRVRVQEVTVDETRAVVGPRGNMRVVRSRSVTRVESRLTSVRVPVQPGATYRFQVGGGEWRVFRAPPAPGPGQPLTLAMVGGMTRISRVSEICQAAGSGTSGADMAVMLEDSATADAARSAPGCAGLVWLSARKPHVHPAAAGHGGLESPPEARYWSTRIGPALFVVLDASGALGEELAQLEWLTRVLAHTRAVPAEQAVPHVVVMASVPDSMPEGSKGQAARAILDAARPVLEEYGVDFAFIGRGHGYERRAGLGGLNQMVVDSEEEDDKAEEAAEGNAGLVSSRVSPTVVHVWGKLTLEGPRSTWQAIAEDGSEVEFVEVRAPARDMSWLAMCFGLIIAVGLAWFYQGLHESVPSGVELPLTVPPMIQETEQPRAADQVMHEMQPTDESFVSVL